MPLALLQDVFFLPSAQSPLPIIPAQFVSPGFQSSLLYVPVMFSGYGIISQLNRLKRKQVENIPAVILLTELIPQPHKGGLVFLGLLLLTPYCLV